MANSCGVACKPLGRVRGAARPWGHAAPLSFRLGDVVVQVFDVSLMEAAISAVRASFVVAGAPASEGALAVLARGLTAAIAADVGHSCSGLRQAVGCVRSRLPGPLAKRLVRIHDGDLELRHLSGPEGDKVLAELLSALASAPRSVGSADSSTSASGLSPGGHVPDRGPCPSEEELAGPDDFGEACGPVDRAGHSEASGEDLHPPVGMVGVSARRVPLAGPCDLTAGVLTVPSRGPWVQEMSGADDLSDVTAPTMKDVEDLSDVGAALGESGTKSFSGAPSVQMPCGWQASLPDGEGTAPSSHGALRQRLQAVNGIANITKKDKKRLARAPQLPCELASCALDSVELEYPGGSVEWGRLHPEMQAIWVAGRQESLKLCSLER